MTDHKFSNQKSALEDYFQSLLSDDFSSDSAEQKTGAEQQTKAVSPQLITTVKSTDAGISEKMPGNDRTISDVDKETPRRPSVADMLAKVSTDVEEKRTLTVDYAEPAAEIKITIPQVEIPTVTETDVLTEVESVAETALESEEKIDVDLEENVEIKHDTVVETAQTTPLVQKSEPPEWADSAFQCLLFQVGGLSLAVPLITLNGVIPWSENVVETPNQTDWYLGVLMNHGNKVQVIDTAVMVLPAEHRKDMADEPGERLSHILLVDDQRWGLACESIGDVVWLKKEDVKWRSNTTKRPWLLGTAIEHMCAVMDTSAFAEMLAGDK
ncbi:MAG: chemotaxis protein CheW [Gammaproteobacteria bacterium]|nr:chemotaxis protein CheW [Gammaproteobacteria bacterium]